MNPGHRAVAEASAIKGASRKEDPAIAARETRAIFSA
jgi:hypothetical protein